MSLHKVSAGTGTTHDEHSQSRWRDIGVDLLNSRNWMFVHIKLRIYGHFKNPQIRTSPSFFTGVTISATHSLRVTRLMIHRASSWSNPRSTAGLEPKRLVYLSKIEVSAPLSAKSEPGCSSVAQVHQRTQLCIG